MNASRLHSLRILAILSVLLLGTAPLSGWEYPTCLLQRVTWDGQSATLSPVAADFPAGSALRASLEYARDAWNQAPGTVFRIHYSYTNDPLAKPGDGVNHVAFDWVTEMGNALSQTFPRVTIDILRSRCFLTETDVLFSTRYNWSGATPPLNPAPRNGDGTISLALTALHEYGHVLGLNHVEDKLATLNSVYPFGGVVGNGRDVQPLADDVAGDRAGYGSYVIARDLAVSAYGLGAPGIATWLSPPAQAYRGHESPPIPLTVMNRGTQQETSARVRFYLSTDPYISTSDHPVGSILFNMDPGFIGTYSLRVFIPATLSSGSYYFGYVIDPDNVVPEVDETNNAVGHFTRILLPAASPPTACFTALPATGPAPLTVTFDASCSSDPVGSISRYEWTFGDGTTGLGRTVTHTYLAAQSYLARLKVIDDTNLTSSKSLTITATSSGGGDDDCCVLPDPD